MSTVLIKGYYGVHNLGDDMILNAVLKSVCMSPNVTTVKICGGGGDKSAVLESICPDTASIFNIDTVSSPGRWDKISYFKSISHYIFGGGGLFPGENTKQLKSILMQFRCAKLTGTKICFYGIEINPVHEDVNKKLWKKIIDEVDFAVLRNRQTFDMLASFGCDPKKLVCSSDVTFSYFSDQQIDLHKEHSKIMLWAPNNLFRREEMPKEDVKIRYQKICKQLAMACDAFDEFHHVFLPFHPEFDVPYITDITRNIQKSSYEILKTENMNPVQLRSCFKDADFCMCFRFHSVIFSLFYAKPFMAISYSPKTSGLLTELGLQDYYEEYGIRESNFFKRAFDLDYDKYLEKAKNAVETMDNNVGIRKISSELKDKATNAEQKLIEWLG